MKCLKTLPSIPSCAAISWADQRGRAAVVMFPRVCDPQNLRVIEAKLLERQCDELYQSLGMLAIFHPSLPTGRYSLNLGRQLDRAVAMRLISVAGQEAEAAEAAAGGGAAGPGAGWERAGAAGAGAAGAGPVGAVAAGAGAAGAWVGATGGAAAGPRAAGEAAAAGMGVALLGAAGAAVAGLGAAGPGAAGAGVTKTAGWRAAAAGAAGGAIRGGDHGEQMVKRYGRCWRNVTVDGAPFKVPANIFQVDLPAEVGGPVHVGPVLTALAFRNIRRLLKPKHGFNPVSNVAYNYNLRHLGVCIRGPFSN